MSHMAVGYQRLHCLGKLITLSIDIYEPAGVQMFVFWCFKKLGESINKYLKDKKQAGIQLKTSENKPLKKTLKKKKVCTSKILKYAAFSYLESICFLMFTDIFSL